MNDINLLYPATPTNVPPSVTQSSAAFKKEVTRVLGSIVLFFLVYLALLLLSVGLVIACFYGGIAIVIGVRHIFGILAGVGLIGLSIMVFIFLVKFLFAVSKFDSSGRNLKPTQSNSTCQLSMGHFTITGWCIFLSGKR